MLKQLGISDDDLQGRNVYHGKGCNRCGGIGFRGRQGIFEMLEMNNEIRELAFNRAPTNELRRAARASGMRNLLEDGKLKILRGITTAREIARRLSDDEEAGDDGRRPEIVTVRAGSSPGMHVVTFDAPGETIELRHTARDRSPFAAGAIAAADWLRSDPRESGIHRFDEVVDALAGTREKPMAVGAG